MNGKLNSKINKLYRLSKKRNDILKQAQRFTAIIEYENHGYVALCPELDIASQGNSVEEAKNNLTEALQLFFECANPG